MAKAVAELANARFSNQGKRLWRHFAFSGEQQKPGGGLRLTIASKFIAGSTKLPQPSARHSPCGVASRSSGQRASCALGFDLELITDDSDGQLIDAAYAVTKACWVRVLLLKSAGLVSGSSGANQRWMQGA